MDYKEKYMKEAYKLAEKAQKEGEVPVGAVIVYENKIIARGYNRRKKEETTDSHAEMVAIKKANKKIGSWRLEDCDLYVTLEPCPMCAGAIVQARIRSVYYGAKDTKAGAFGSVFDLAKIEGLNHYPSVEGGIMEEECGAILTEFFKNLRGK
jgi:tRNA(adenine34) deaminase